jgi:hypothetical protein
MINIIDFKEFLKQTFLASELYLDDFKPDLQFAELDSFKSKPYKLVVEISAEQIQISAISKKTRLDFSVYEYSFDNNEDAKKFIVNANEKGEFPFLPGADLSLLD